MVEGVKVDHEDMRMKLDGEDNEEHREMGNESTSQNNEVEWMTQWDELWLLTVKS